MAPAIEGVGLGGIRAVAAATGSGVSWLAASGTAWGAEVGGVIVAARGKLGLNKVCVALKPLATVWVAL